MWETLHAVVVLHHKAFGVIGDSLTFAGALLLAAEAIWKKKERTAIATKQAVVTYFPNAEEKGGAPVSATTVEKRWLGLWSFASKAGAIALAAGFAFLLLVRIFAE